MKVFINGTPRDWLFDNTHSLDDAINIIRQELLQKELLIINEIKLEKIPNGLDKTQTTSNVKANDIPELSVEAEPYAVFCQKSFMEAQNKLPELRSLLEEIIEKILIGDVDVGMKSLTTLTEGLIWFCSILAGAYQILGLDFENILCNNISLNEFIQNLNSILKDLETALESNDLTLINDYLEYELKPAIESLNMAVPIILNHIRSKVN